MADRATVMLGDCLLAMRARVAGADARHAAALWAEARARSVQADAEALLAAAVAAWRGEMAGGFDPVMASLLAARVETAGRGVTEAVGACDAAETCRVRTSAVCTQEQARRRAVEELAAIARRRACRAADERLLTALADRETVRWSGR